MSEVNAWLLDLGEGLIAAVSDLELLHVLLDEPALFEIPQSPAYCRNVLVWQGKILPLMNLAARLLGRPVVKNQGFVAVTAFQACSGAETRYGAIMLHAPPARIQVNDSMACDLPESLFSWRGVSVACFEYPGSGPVPVLDLGKVFLALQEDADEPVRPRAIFQLESNEREPRCFIGEKI